MWYRIHLTVTDSGGAVRSGYVDVRPRTATLSLETVPPGLRVTLDGQPITTPATVDSVVGLQRVLGVISPQSHNGLNYGFASWSDGGAASHAISTPATGATYTATYQAQSPGDGAATFAHPAAITIPSLGAGGPYPAPITVSGMSGTVAEVTATLHDLTHTYPDDLRVLLVGPAGQESILLARAGGGADANGLDLTFAQTDSLDLTDSGLLITGRYWPALFGPNDSLAAPAPAAPYPVSMSAFDGANPNGTCSLYVLDSAAGDAGTIEGGWSLSLRTTPLQPASLGQRAELRNLPASPITRNDQTAPRVTAALLPDGRVRISWPAWPGVSCRLQVSTDLIQWRTLFAGVAVHPQQDYLDSPADPSAQRFYRVIQVGRSPDSSRER